MSPIAVRGFPFLDMAQEADFTLLDNAMRVPSERFRRR
jgi:hypothetical protein